MKRLLSDKRTITIISIVFFSIIMFILIIFLVGFVYNAESNLQMTNSDNSDTSNKGKCLEYKTIYKLDCGFFACNDDSICCERKYDECVRWEDET